MRIGLSPTREQSTDYHPARVTVCVLVFIPDQVGYFAQRFEVLKLCLQSILKHTKAPYDLLVFDNGSCPEVVDYLRVLRDQGRIHYLLLSARNIGKLNALKIMCQAAPGEVVAYSDEDVLFYPGWLEAQLEILDTFPRVGMVSGVAVREQFRYGNHYLQPYLADFPEISVRYGHFIPDEWERDFFVSTGREPGKELAGARHAYKDIVLEYKAVKAYSTATHFQFIALKSVILRGFKEGWESQLMASEQELLDENIDSLGYARLATFHRYVQHIGNIVTADFAANIARLGVGDEVKTWRPPRLFLTKLTRVRIFRRIFRAFYNQLYFFLNYRPLP